jgi:hypothetical protein
MNYKFTQIKKHIFKKLLKWGGYDREVKIQNRYWPNREDTMFLSDLIILNHTQLEAFPVITPSGEKIWIQSSHYLNYL